MHNPPRHRDRQRRVGLGSRMGAAGLIEGRLALFWFRFLHHKLRFAIDALSDFIFLGNFKKRQIIFSYRPFLEILEGELNG